MPNEELAVRLVQLKALLEGCDVALLVSESGISSLQVQFIRLQRRGTKGRSHLHAG